jgi:hypothetical protein
MAGGDGSWPSPSAPGGFAPVPPAPPWAAVGPGSSARARRPAAPWRRPLAIVLLVVGCIATPLALSGAYVHTRIMDVDGYVSAVTPVASDPAVQNAIADLLSGQISKALKKAGTTTSPLPAELGSIASGLSDVLPIGDVTRKLTRQALQSDAFRSFWAEANRRIHPILMDAIEHGGGGDTSPLSLDLSAVTSVVTDKLAIAGVGLPDPLPKALRTGEVPLLDSLPLKQLGSALRALDRLWLVLFAVAAAGLLGCVVAARARLRAGAVAGAGLALAMFALELGLWVARGRYLGVTDRSHIPRDAAAAVFNAMTSSLREWGWAALVVGVAAAVACLAVSVVLRSAGRAP